MPHLTRDLKVTGGWAIREGLQVERTGWRKVELKEHGPLETVKVV